MNSVLGLRHVVKEFEQAEKTLQVLRGVDLELKAGEVVALVGPSGSGKTTLLQIAGLLDNPTSGEVMIAGHDLSKAGDRERTDARLKHIGFVYQFHHLLPEFSALENIALPGSHNASPGQAFRWRTAACGNCPRACERSGAFAC